MLNLIKSSAKWQRATLVSRLLSYDINDVVRYTKPQPLIQPLLTFELSNRKKAMLGNIAHDLSFAINKDLSVVLWNKHDAKLNTLKDFTPFREAVADVFKCITIANVSYTFSTSMQAWNFLVQEDKTKLPYTTRTLKLKTVERTPKEISTNSYIEIARALKTYLAHAIIHETKELELEPLHNVATAKELLSLSKTTQQIYQFSNFFLEVQEEAPRIRLGKFLKLNEKAKHKISRQDLEWTPIVECQSYSEQTLYETFMSMITLAFTEVNEFIFEQIAEEIPFWFDHSPEELADCHDGLDYFKVKWQY